VTHAIIPRAETTDLDTITLGKVLSQSGYFQDARDAAQAIVKVLAGRELGIGPIQAMVGIYIVKGRVTLSANLIAAAIKRSGHYNYRVKRMDDKGCAIEFFEGSTAIGTSTFDETDARAAGLLGGDNWKKFPRNMYFARAMSNGAKWYCPDIFMGPIYTPDELGAAVNSEGEVLEPPQAPPAPRQVDVTTGEIIEAAAVTSDRARLLARFDEVITHYRKINPDWAGPSVEEIAGYSDEQLIQQGKQIKERIAFREAQLQQQDELEETAAVAA
jgi:hypothetical protein